MRRVPVPFHWRNKSVLVVRVPFLVAFILNVEELPIFFFVEAGFFGECEVWEEETTGEWSANGAGCMVSFPE